MTSKEQLFHLKLQQI